MKAPVRICSSEALASKMRTDRTVMQARGPASIPGMPGHGVALPDGRQGHGFPAGAGMDAEGALPAARDAA